MNAIPGSAFSSVTPSVLNAGGNPLSLNSLWLSQDASIPIGAVYSFPNATEVADWFGSASPEAAIAGNYFKGFDTRTSIPNALLFGQYNTSAVGAYLRSGTVAGLTLAQLQAFSGVIDVTVDGRAVISASINLASATSFSNAAALIQTGLQVAGGVFTGTASFSGTTMTVVTVASGAIHVGDPITATGVTPGTTVSAFLSGTGGTGTYTLSASVTTEATEATTVASAATCTYDPQRAAFVIHSPTTGATSTIGYGSGALGLDLLFSAALGANISQGAAIAVPATLMNQLTGITQNFATFMPVTEPILSVKLAFAAWTQTQNDEFAYVQSDSDQTALSPAASGSFGALTTNDDGVVAIYDNSGTSVLGAFFCGMVASIDRTRKNGRITFAFKGQSGVTAQITDLTQYNNLKANGYNCYANVADRTQQFQWFQPGLISGDWDWADTYINQIGLNADIQDAVLVGLGTVNSLPYNVQGYSLIESWCADPIQAALNFGSIVPSVTLSNAQKAEINTAAGVDIATTISQVGYYLQILDAAPTTRQLRQSPPITLWYSDGGSIQQINIASIAVQ